MFEAVIFDVDGTLLDTERIGMESWQKAGAMFGYTISMTTLLNTRGISRKEGMKVFRRDLGDAFPYEQIQPIRIQLGEEIVHSGIDLVKPGVRDTLSHFRKQGVPMAVASSTVYSITSEHLSYFGLLPYFDAVVGGDMIEKGKPNPDIFLKAASMLGVQPEKCLVLEDSPAGVCAASAAGMKVILIPDCIPATPPISEKCLTVMDSMAQLIPYLQTIAP